MLIRFLKNVLSDRPRCDCRSLALEGKQAFDAMDFRTAQGLLHQVQEHCGLNADGLYMLGAASVHDGRFGEAEVALRSVLNAEPGNLPAKKMLAMRHLLDGNWSTGFELYESMRHAAMRQAPPNEPDLNRDWLRFIDYVLADIPQWRGESLKGKRIVVWSEHGRGDAIMTMRLVPELRDRLGARGIMGMSDMAEKCLFNAAGVAEFQELRADWRPAPGDFDFHCSIFSLLYLLDVRPEKIPGSVPYLEVPSTRVEEWKERLSGIRGLRVGLVWGGNPAVPFDKLRSVSLGQLRPLLATPNVNFVSLQKEGPAREEPRDAGLSLVDMMDQCTDFMDTAALVANLDLVVSVDSAVAHLAGAIGKPVWLLNRYESEWRWLRGREDSVWYPSMRIFNQTEPRNWGPIIDRMAVELHKLAVVADSGTGNTGEQHV